MTDTPRVNALESNPLDSFDFRAWKTLARELERELIWASGEKAKLTEIVAARPEESAIAVSDRAGDFACGQDRIFPDSMAISKQFRVQYAEQKGLTDECYPYSLKDGNVTDAKGRRVTVAGNRSIRDMLNEIAELRAAVAQRSTSSPLAAPAAWVATKGDKVLHLAKADGWRVEVVQTEPQKEPQP